MTGDSPSPFALPPNSDRPRETVERYLGAKRRITAFAAESDSLVNASPMSRSTIAVTGWSVRSGDGNAGVICQRGLEKVDIDWLGQVGADAEFEHSPASGWSGVGG